ncbi:RCC1-like domain-containing protein [Corynebacterium glaucum]
MDRNLVAAGASHAVSILPDGNVVAAGANFLGQSDSGAWQDIISIAAG